jgi:hypothetical protein
MKSWKITFTNSNGSRPSIFAKFLTFAEAASYAYMKKKSAYAGFRIESISSREL